MIRSRMALAVTAVVLSLAVSMPVLAQGTFSDEHRSDKYRSQPAATPAVQDGGTAKTASVPNAGAFRDPKYPPRPGGMSAIRAAGPARVSGAPDVWGSFMDPKYRSQR